MNKKNIIHSTLQQGIDYLQKEQYIEAERAFLSVLKQETSHFHALENLTHTLVKQKRFSDALANQNVALSYYPFNPSLLFEKANLLHILKEYVEEEALYHTILHKDVSNIEAYARLGNLLLQAGRCDDAINFFSSALKHISVKKILLNMLGNIMRDYKNDLAASLALYRDALRIDPFYMDALINSADLCLALKRYTSAKNLYERALMRKEIEGAIYLAKTLTGLLEAKYHLCDWENSDVLHTQLRNLTQEQITLGHATWVMPFQAIMFGYDEKLQCDIAKNYAHHHLSPFFQKEHDASPSSLLKKKSKKIRIGYLSNDFCNHPTMHLMAPLFSLYNKENYEIYAYSTGIDDKSSYRNLVQEKSDHFVDISTFSFQEAAFLIKEDAIDILIDVGGYTAFSRPHILALRPCSIQIAYLAYPGTSGAPWIDYLITDRNTVPLASEIYYTEKLLFMPDTYFITDNTHHQEEGPSREECRLKKDAIVFCCFNATYKIDKEIFTSWMRILSAVPKGILWLLTQNPVAEENLRKEAQKHNIDSDRLIFAPHLPKALHLGRHKHIDLFLDCSRCNAHTTAVDALYMGIPVLTIKGKSWPTRVGESLAFAMDAPELMLGSLEEYERKAIYYASCPKILTQLHEKVRHARAHSALFNTKKYVRNFEVLLASLV